MSLLIAVTMEMGTVMEMVPRRKIPLRGTIVRNSSKIFSMNKTT